MVIFPVLENGLSAAEQRKRTSNFNRFNNKQLKEIAVKLELDYFSGWLFDLHEWNWCLLS